MGKVHFASSTVHSPWTALRVRWVPVYCFPTLSLRAFAMCAVFPHSDYYARFDCLQGLGAFTFPRNKNAALPVRAQKDPLDPQRPEKKWVPDGTCGHELSRPKRVSWLPAYGMM